MMVNASEKIPFCKREHVLHERTPGLTRFLHAPISTCMFLMSIIGYMWLGYIMWNDNDSLSTLMNTITSKEEIKSTGYT